MSTGTRSEWRTVAAELRVAGKPAVQIAGVLRERFKVGALAAMRYAHGWSQHDAAKQWNDLFSDQLTSVKTYKDISAWETDRHTPPIPTLDKLAQVYSCDLGDLLADRQGYRLAGAQVAAADEASDAASIVPVENQERPGSVPMPVPVAGHSAPYHDFVHVSSRYREVGNDAGDVLNPVSLLHESQELDLEALASLIVMSAQRARLALGRREVLSKLSAALALAAAAPVFNSGVSLAGDRHQAGQVLDEPGRLDPITLGHTESIISACRRQADLLGPQAPLQTALAQRSLMAGVLPDAPSSVRSRAEAVYAEICQLAGWLLFNLGDYRSAMTYYDEARTVAHDAEDVELVTYVLCTMSHLATWSGRPRVGIDHAVAATNWADRAHSPLAQAYAADVSVRAYTGAGQQSDAQAALERECVAYDLAIADAGDTRPWWYFFDESFPLSTETQYALRFGETERAHRIINRSLDLVDKTNLHNYSLRLLYRTEALVQGGDVTEACQLLGDVAELTASNTSRRVNQRVRQLRELVADESDGEAVRTLDDRLATHGYPAWSEPSR